MSPIWDAACPFHFQSDPDWCGPASAMMALAKLGVPYSKLAQKDLFSSIRVANCSPGSGKWRSDPCGIEGVLNAFRPGEWHLYVRNGLDEATRDIVYSLRQHRRPTVALIYGSHWVVVNSVATDSDPVSGAFRIKALWVHNPSPDARTNPPATHGGNDICMHAQPDKVSWVEWRKQYLLAKKDDLWNRKPRFIVVSDPDSRGGFGSVERLAEARPRDIDFAVARSNAEFYLRSYADYEPGDPNGAVLGNIMNAESGIPLRVEQPYREEGERYYYLIPFSQEGKVVASIKVDRGGRFRSLRIHQGGQEFAPPMVREEKGWIWLPSEESRSPHLPFRAEFNLLNHNQGRRYTRLDGQSFPELTPLRDG